MGRRSFGGTALLVAGLGLAGTAHAGLIVSGVIDGPLAGGNPRAIEFFATSDIPDLSEYGFGSANNGGGTDGEEFTFPAVAAGAGDFIYVAKNEGGFTDFFGFPPDYTTNVASIDGDDAIEVFFQGSVVDVFSDINVDGTGQPWEYLDGWAYRVDGTGPDGTTFVLANWFFSGINALDGEATNDTATTPWPLGTYVAGQCLLDADCDDFVGCTDDSCVAGACAFTTNDANCPDDGLFCNSAEVCDALIDCTSAGDPCAPGTFCNEDTDTCDECVVDVDCNDGVGCTNDVCVDGSCVSTPDDANCDNGLFCDGNETCDALNDCQPGTPLPDCCKLDADCDDGDACNGVEVCDLGTNTCVLGTSVDCDDAVVCTVDTCDPKTGLCSHEPESCEGDANCDGAVDPLDSGFVLARFGCPVGTGNPACDSADVNADGEVNPLDAGFVLARFGACP